MSKFTNKLETETLKFILLNQLIEIYMEQFKDYAHVIPKYKIIKPSQNDIQTERREKKIEESKIEC